MKRRTAKLKQSTAAATYADASVFRDFLTFIRTLPNSDRRLSDMTTPDVEAAVEGAPLDVALRVHHGLGPQSVFYTTATPADLRREANERKRRAKLAALRSIFLRVWERRGPNHGKQWLCERTAALFAGVGDFPADLRDMARDVLASGRLDTTTPPASGTIEGWTDGETIDALLGDRRSQFCAYVERLKPLLAWIADVAEGEADVTKEFLAEEAALWIDQPDDDLSPVAAELAADFTASGLLNNEPDTLAAIRRWIDAFSVEELTSGE